MVCGHQNALVAEMTTNAPNQESARAGFAIGHGHHRPHPHDSLSRRIGVTTASAVVIGSMIGSGIFTTSGFIARDVGSPTRLIGLWAVGGLIALAGALCYGELGAAMPEAGGEYVYLREAYGTFVAYLSGWTSFFLGFSGAIAAATLAFVDYLHHLFPGLDPGNASGKTVALAVLWLLTGAHVAGVGPGGTLQRVLAAATVVGMAALIVLGFSSGQGSASNFSSTTPAQGSPAVALIFVLYAYSGWNAAAYLGGEIREPSRNLPAALIAGTVAVTLLYLGMNVIYLYAMPIGAMSGILAVADKASVALLGPKAGNFTDGLVALTLLASTSAMVLSGPRVYYAMARDGVFFRSIGRMHPTLGTPVQAMVLQAAWASVLILFFGVFERLVLYTGFAVTVFAALAVASLIVLRVRHARLARPFGVPAYPLLPAGYVAVSAWIAGYTIVNRPAEAVLAILTVAAGVPFYFLGRFWDRDHLRPPSADSNLDFRTP
jgi:APA family basic amino acid/polyamine antiporter